MSPASMTFTHGATYHDLPVPEWAFHEFLGWRCGEQMISEGAAVELTENAVFTAEWREIPRIEIGYDIYFRDDTFGRQTTRFVEWGEPTELNAVFTQSGYRITGWVQTEGEELRLYSLGDVITLTRSDLPGGELHLQAMWRETGETPIAPPPGGDELMSIGEPEDLFGISARPSMSMSMSVPQSVPPQSQQSQPSNAYVKSYAYDLAGNRTSFTVTRGGTTVQSLSYTYNNLNRLVAVNEGNTALASYDYDVNGNRASLSYKNGVTTTYTYNAANWVTGVINKRGNTALSSYSYTYYPSGNQASKRDHNTGVTTTYNYDGLGRLTRESESGGLTLSYTYDSAGNRTRMTASGTESYTINYSYDANNRLTSSVYADGTHASTYSYDKNGNLLTAQEWKPQEGIASTASYSYNNLNQLASQTVNGRSSSFAYNADGIRTAKTVGRRLVGYLLDGGNVIGETEGGELVATYQRGVNLISCIDPRDTNFEETYYLYNAHGDVVQLADEHGNLTKTYEYDAFGNEKNRTSDPNPFRYCGEYYDAESGSYYLRARYYNPAVGRFTQEDPIRDGPNWYAYCGSNPVAFIDPSGNAAVDALNDKTGGAVTAFGSLERPYKPKMRLSEAGMELLIDYEVGNDPAIVKKDANGKILEIRNRDGRDGGITIGFGIFVEKTDTERIKQLAEIGIIWNDTTQWIDYETAVKAHKIISDKYSERINNLIERVGVELTQQQYDALYLLVYNYWALLNQGGVVETLILSGADRATWEEEIIAAYQRTKYWDDFKDGWINRTKDTLELYFDGDYKRNH